MFKKNIFVMIFAVVSAFPVLARGGDIKVGVISEKPVEIIKNYVPFAHYLAGTLKGFNITEGEVVVAKSIEEASEKIKSKDIDIVFETAFATVKLHEMAGMQPRLLAWKKGVRGYKSLFFVRKDGGIKNLKDLRGKILCFESPESTSAYAIPKAEVRRLGLPVVPLEGKARRDAVNYVFVRRSENQLFHVVQKKADAGAFSSNDWDEVPPRMKEELSIIHETKTMPRNIVSFNPAMSSDLQEAISDILIRMNNDAEGLKALKSAQGTSKVERLSDDDLKSLAYVKSILGYIEE